MADRHLHGFSKSMALALIDFATLHDPDRNTWSVESRKLLSFVAENLDFLRRSAGDELALTSWASAIDAKTASRRYLSTNEVARRYGREVRTIQRWLVAPPEGFPKPFKMMGRWFWSAAALNAYDDEMSRCGEVA